MELPAYDVDDPRDLPREPWTPRYVFCEHVAGLAGARFAVRRAGRDGVTTRGEAERIGAPARSLFSMDRRWPAILRTARLDGAPAGPLAATDVKDEDARRAVDAFRALPDRPAARVELCALPRYRGHDRALGRSAGELTPCLLEWPPGSGRYHRYVRPVASASSARSVMVRRSEGGEAAWGA